MRNSPDISLEEAQMRFIRMLKEREYPLTGRWVRDEGSMIYSMPLKGTPDVRALMWREGKKWAASLSMQVGEKGEWILAGGLIGRQKRQSWDLPSTTKLVGDMIEMRETLPRWAMERDRYLNVIAMVKLAHSFTRKKGGRLQLERILAGIERGVISEATTSEALSIAQYLYCRNRLERVECNRIWREVFR